MQSERFAIIDPAYELREREHKLEPKKVKSPLTIDYAKNLIYNAATQIFPEKSFRVEEAHDDYYGAVVKLTTDLNARNALNLWLEIIKNKVVKTHRVAMAVEWLGENNLTKHELAEYLVKIMLASERGPHALRGFDAVADVREMRSE